MRGPGEGFSFARRTEAGSLLLLRKPAQSGSQEPGDACCEPRLAQSSGIILGGPDNLGGTGYASVACHWPCQCPAQALEARASKLAGCTPLSRPVRCGYNEVQTDGEAILTGCDPLESWAKRGPKKQNEDSCSPAQESSLEAARIWQTVVCLIRRPTAFTTAIGLNPGRTLTSSLQVGNDS